MGTIHFGEHKYVQGLNLKAKDKCSFCGSKKNLYRRETCWNGLYICEHCLAQKKMQEKAAHEASVPKKKEYNYTPSFRAPKKEISEAPKHIQWYAKHPMQGGGFSGK